MTVLAGTARQTLRRLLTLLVVLALVHAFFTILPGNGIRGVLGVEAADPEIAEAVRRFGLDRAWPVQFADWLAHALVGDPGTTRSGAPIAAMLATRYPHTLMLAGLATLAAAVCSLAVASYTLMRPRDRAARALVTASNVLLALPEYLLASVLVLVFAVWLSVLPSVAITDAVGAVTPTMLVLPVASLAIPQAAKDVQLIRAGLIEALDSPSAHAMRLDGLPERTILARNSLPAVLPTIATVLAVSLSPMLGGAVLVEALFNYPGIGTVFAGSVSDRDPALACSAVALTAATILVALVASDAVRAWTLRGRR